MSIRLTRNSSLSARRRLAMRDLDPPPPTTRKTVSRRVFACACVSVGVCQAHRHLPRGRLVVGRHRVAVVGEKGRFQRLDQHGEVFRKVRVGVGVIARLGKGRVEQLVKEPPDVVPHLVAAGGHHRRFERQATDVPQHRSACGCGGRSSNSRGSGNNSSRGRGRGRGRSRGAGRRRRHRRRRRGRCVQIAWSGHPYRNGQSYLFMFLKANKRDAPASTFHCVMRLRHRVTAAASWTFLRRLLTLFPTRVDFGQNTHTLSPDVPPWPPFVPSGYRASLGSFQGPGAALATR